MSVTVYVSTFKQTGVNLITFGEMLEIKINMLGGGGVLDSRAISESACNVEVIRN